MPGIFNNKYFNAQVFQRYMDTVPNLKRNELIRSGAIRRRPELATALAEGTGGNFLSTPLIGLIIGQAPQNYDGQTDLETDGIGTYMHDRIVVGRMKGWVENDFTFDITGGQDFMAAIAAQVAAYWDNVDNETLIAIMAGIFSMTDAGSLAFVNNHTYDITSLTNEEGVTGCFDATTLNTGMQHACGDRKASFNLALMHSVVATNLENQKILKYLRYTDANGMERDTGLATLNGRLVLVDDAMPVELVGKTAGVYTVTIAGTLASGDKITVLGTEVTLDSTSAASATAAATAVVNAIGTNDTYTLTRSSGVITFTEKSGKYGSGAPAASIVSTAGTVTVATGTSPVVDKVYDTFVLGNGSIEYTDCGAKVPSEMDRNASKNGGQDMLYTRQRKCFSPWGISFTKAAMNRLSPSDAELMNGVNWKVVADSTGNNYIDHRSIAIAKVRSLG